MDFCSIASGSSGNCIYAGSGRTAVLVDAGISGKRIEEGLNSIERKTAEVDGILITHEHSDHVKGLGVVARKYHIPIYATGKTIAALKGMGTLGKIEETLFHEVIPDEKFFIKDLEILPFSVPHDAADPVAYPGKPRKPVGGSDYGPGRLFGLHNRAFAGTGCSADGGKP